MVVITVVGAVHRTFVIRRILMDGIRIITIVILPTNILGADASSELTAERQRAMISTAVEEMDITRLQPLARRVQQIQLTPRAVHEENRTSLQNGMSVTKEHEEMQQWIADVRTTEPVKVAEQIHAWELHADVNAATRTFLSIRQRIAATMTTVRVAAMTMETILHRTLRLPLHNQPRARHAQLIRQAEIRTQAEIAAVTHEAAVARNIKFTLHREMNWL
jgi:hypothetical protein